MPHFVNGIYLAVGAVFAAFFSASLVLKTKLGLFMVEISLGDEAECLLIIKGVIEDDESDKLERIFEILCEFNVDGGVIFLN